MGQVIGQAVKRKAFAALDLCVEKFRTNNNVERDWEWEIEYLLACIAMAQRFLVKLPIVEIIDNHIIPQSL